MKSNRKAIISDCVDAYQALRRAQANVDKAETILHQRIRAANFTPAELAEYVRQTGG